MVPAPPISAVHAGPGGALRLRAVVGLAIGAVAAFHLGFLYAPWCWLVLVFWLALLGGWWLDRFFSQPTSHP